MDEGTQTQGAGPSHRHVEMGVAIAVAIFGLIVMLGSLQIGIGWGPEGPKSGFFPFYVGALIVGASAINLIEAAVSHTDKTFADWAQLRQVLAVVIPAAVYVGIVPWIGLYVASILLITLFMMRIGRYPWYGAFPLALAVMAVTYWTFERWFLVPLPKGPIEELLGL